MRKQLVAACMAVTAILFGVLALTSSPVSAEYPSNPEYPAKGCIAENEVVQPGTNQCVPGICPPGTTGPSFGVCTPGGVVTPPPVVNPPVPPVVVPPVQPIACATSDCGFSGPVAAKKKAAPVALAVTGNESSMLGYIATGLIAVGALALGSRRKFLQGALD